jgi:folate-binding protein YgfZ
VGDNLAVVGYEPYKDKVLDHLQLRVLQQNVTIRDITTLNNVYLSTENYPSQSGITVTRSYLGWILVTSVKNSLKESMTFEQFTEYRTKNIIPYQQHEITSDVHPFNCGLEHLVHEAKGCYIGQEILTRMRSRGKMGKQLVQVQIDAEDATSVGNEYALAIRRVPP